MIVAPDPPDTVERRALLEILRLDFAKTPDGMDDFYSGAPMFVKAWLIAHAAISEAP